MDVEQRLALVTRNTEEVVTDEELRKLLTEKEEPTAYIGFEPSGLVHLGWVLVAQKIRDLTDAGFRVTIFWADWHAYINDKLGGDLENIRTCARYMQDCFIALGVPEDKVEFKYASEILNDIEYWEMAIKVAKVTSLSRVKRAMTIMGRSEDEAEVDTSKVFYPILQATDIFCMGLDVAYAGLDQRRAHMLARDAADKLGWKKPIALHTPLLPGLKGGNRMDPVESKMSKSDPNGSVKIHDTRDEIASKMKKAYCPPEREHEGENPVLMLCRYILFPRNGAMHPQERRDAHREAREVRRTRRLQQLRRARSGLLRRIPVPCRPQGRRDGWSRQDPPAREGLLRGEAGELRGDPQGRRERQEAQMKSFPEGGTLRSLF